MKKPTTSLRCPRCNASLKAGEEQAGQTLPCHKCGNELLVPGKKHAGSDLTVDDLIDLDDDVLDPVDSPDPEAARPAVAPTPVDPGQSANPARDEVPDLAEWPVQQQDGLPGNGESADEPPENDLVLTPLADEDVDLDDLLPPPEPGEPREPVAGENPFEIDDHAPLRVDGITPTDSEFPITCHLCGSLLYGRLSQVGTRLKCHDCHSLVDVVAPRNKDLLTPLTETPTDPPTGEDEGYTLEPAADLPPLDTTIDQSFGPIDYDDDSFFERKKQLEAGMDLKSLVTADSSTGDEDPTPAAPSRAPAADTGDEYGLAPPEEDLLKPLVEPTDSGTPEAEAEPPPREEPAAVTVPPQASREEVVRVSPEPASIGEDEPSPPTSPRPIKPAGNDIATPLSAWPGWLTESFQVVRQPITLVKVVLCSIVLGFANLFLWWGIGNLMDEEQLTQFGGYALVCIGAVPTVLVWIFVGILSNPIIRDAVEQRKSTGEWPDFSLADMFSQFIFVATSFWLAAVPGLILGQILWATTEFFWLFPFCMLLSSLCLAPFFMSSVIFNESPLALVSGESFQTLRVFPNRWFRYWLVVIPLSVLVVLAMAAPALGFLMYFVSPVIQLVLMVMVFWMIGDLAGRTVRYMEDLASR